MLVSSKSVVADSSSSSSRAGWGAILMMCEGLCGTMQYAVAKFAHKWHLPFWRMNIISCIVVGLICAISLVKMHAEMPAMRSRKWILLRGSFTCGLHYACVLAVQLGTPLGDVGSLTSINIVIAAFLGHAFLGERIQVLHVIALCCSLTGVVLISKPGFIFGNQGVATSVIGSCLAMGSGFCQACAFVATRKALKTPAPFFVCSTCVQSISVSIIFVYLGVLKDFSLDAVVAFPARTTGVQATMISLTLGVLVMGMMGSRWCPVAVSATLSTGMRMVCGYLVQIFLFGVIPDFLTIAGALLMILGVIIMARARKSTLSGQQPSADAKSQEMEMGVEVGNEEDNESLASFISAEYAELEPKHQGDSESMRQRRSVQAAVKLPTPEMIGAALSMSHANA